MKAEILSIDAQSPEPEKITKAARLIQEGKLVAFPTDTVYGLGADAFNAEAVEQVFRAKGRGRDKPLPLLISSFTDLESLVEEVSPGALLLIGAFWPGALTLVFKASKKVSPLCLSNSGKVALRIPNNQVALSLIRASGGVLTGSSANLSGDPEPLRARDAEIELGDRIELILDGGDVDLGAPSTILDVSSSPPRALRWGIISQVRIEEILEEKVVS